MTIRTKLLLFIPLLVVFANIIAYFVFQSGKVVQQSYDEMLETHSPHRANLRIGGEQLKAPICLSA